MKSNLILLALVGTFVLAGCASSEKPYNNDGRTVAREDGPTGGMPPAMGVPEEPPTAGVPQRPVGLPMPSGVRAENACVRAASYSALVKASTEIEYSSDCTVGEITPAMRARSNPYHTYQVEVSCQDGVVRTYEIVTKVTKNDGCLLSKKK